MGKIYEAEMKDIAIVDGVITGCTIIDNFSSQNDTTKGIRKLTGVTFSLDGLPIETAVKFLWDALKVKMQARSFKDMADADFEALDGGSHSVLDHIATKERTSSKVAILNTAKKELMTQFYNQALVKALEDLGDDAEQDDITAWASEYYDTEYKTIVEAMT